MLCKLSGQKIKVKMVNFEQGDEIKKYHEKLDFLEIFPKFINNRNPDTLIPLNFMELKNMLDKLSRTQGLG
jgi:hypothetical protein